MTSERLRKAGLGLATLLAVAGSVGAASATTVTIVSLDGAGEGTNDPTPVAPVGGNPGTTRGEQRRLVFEHVANALEQVVYSASPIVITVDMTDLACSSSAIALGFGGPAQAWVNTKNAPRRDTWYPIGLANALAGKDLAPNDPDVAARFNATVDSTDCAAGRHWYYGFDRGLGDDFDFVQTVTHEFVHGLGFTSMVDRNSGAYFGGKPDAYSSFIRDLSLDRDWTSMSDGERAASVTNVHGLGWTGPLVTAAMPDYFESSTPLAFATSPPGAGAVARMWVGTADFGPSPRDGAVTGLLREGADGADEPGDGCDPLIGVVTDRIVLLDASEWCDVQTQVLSAQDAGARGVLIASTAPGGPPPALHGLASTLIPVVSIMASDAASLRSKLLAAEVEVTLGVDDTLLLGAHPDGYALLHSPNPSAGGSSISHWSLLPTPSLLLEPVADSEGERDVTLEQALLADIGWPLTEPPPGGAGGEGGEGGAGGAAASAGSGGAEGPPVMAAQTDVHGGGCSAAGASRAPSRSGIAWWVLAGAGLAAGGVHRLRRRARRDA